MENLAPAAKIANLNAGKILSIVVTENNAFYGEYSPNVLNCKVTLDLDAWSERKKQNKQLPEFDTVGNSIEKIILC
jgi:hypothetical protein